ncbi:MAG TPA: GTPase [Ktedonobacteraceae bacterium]|nr:GTPase [Ktedonobacteraceae bacterium]
MAAEQNPVEAEDNKKLEKNLFDSVIRGNLRPKNARELGLAAVKNLPATIGAVQGLMKTVNWKKAQADILEEIEQNVVIVGQPNTGKSTLFNTIKGQKLSAVSPRAGTTREVVPASFGPFRLVDTPGIDKPGSLPDDVKNELDDAGVIVFLIDATRGLQETDRQIYEAIKKLGKPMLLAINKIDALTNNVNGDSLATEIAIMLNVTGVIPISAKTGENIAEELLPAMIEASPEAAFLIGRELPKYRSAAAQRLIRNSTLVSLAAGIEPIPLIDIPILLGTQIRLVLRIAALYGEPLDSADAMKHARKLVATMVGGLGFRFLAEQAAKVVPFGGDFIAGAIAGAATWSIGQVALEYYEGGKQIAPRRLRQLYFDFYRRFRKEHKVEEIKEYALEGQDEPLLLEGPKTAAE